MGWIRKTTPAICMFCLLLSGCKAKEFVPEEPLVYVTQVSVDYEYRLSHLRRSYTDSDKMDVFLYYLYDLSPHGKPEEDPEQIQGDSCKITLSLSDGTQRVYRQIGSQYLSIDWQPWQKINQGKGSVLFHLVNHIQSDM